MASCLKRAWKVPILFFPLFLQGCVSTSAHWQDKTYKPNKKGVLFYNSQPSLFDGEAVQKRERDAKMKMADFCGPKKPEILTETNREEVTGYHTYSSSLRDNPHPSYQSHSLMRSTGSGFFSKSASSMVSKPFLHSSASQTSTALTRHRVYIHFACK